ncbi:MAG: nucleotide exchange factor GrpE [Actinomycetota bacterium]|nr:nucleotide exchange factor GrpE [Actinomycetota bacterium]
MSDDFDTTLNGAGAGDEPAPSTEAAVEEAEIVEAEPVDELTQARADAAGYLDDLRRLKAEFENYRKRVTREQTAFMEIASLSLVERLLPVLDNFELALIAADRTKDYTALVRGVELVFSEFKDVLGKQGLKRIDAEGQPFDPELHEAVMQGEGPDEGKPVVGEVFRTGYTLGGKVVRPAMVKVVRQ